MAKLTEKEVSEIFGIKTASLPDEQRTFINAMVGAFTDVVEIYDEYGKRLSVFQIWK